MTIIYKGKFLSEESVTKVVNFEIDRSLLELNEYNLKYNYYYRNISSQASVFNQ